MSEAHRPWHWHLLTALLLGCHWCSAGAVPDDETGRRIVDVVAELREAGITIIYSEDLLDASLRVREPPAADEPLARLREMLAPYDLTLEAGPRGSWLVVRRESAAAAESAPALERGPGPAVAPPALERVVVSASRYAAYRDAAASVRIVSRDRLENSPALGQDALRTTHDLPGVTSGGLTARMHVRGGELDEVLMRLDGVRLFDPFHLKDFQNIFSSINARALESMEVRTGAYPAEYGDRLSGVVDMKSVTPTEPRHHEIAVSTLSTSVLSSGVFGEGRGAWVTSLRRGNLDLLLDAAESSLGSPQYGDFFNKVSYAMTPRWRVTTGALALDDKLSLNDGDEAHARADYDDTYLWLRFEQDSGRRLSADYAVSHARLTRKRNGTIDDPDQSLSRLDEIRRFSDDTLRADWTYELSDRQRLEWGAELERQRARYAFESALELPVPIAVGDLDGFGRPPAAADLALDGEQYAAYVSYRARLFASLTTELGLRWDRQTYSDEDQLSPRLGLLVDVGDRTSLRLSWGRYYQSEGLDELRVADGITRIQPVQRADHLVLSLDRSLGDRVELRLEAYRKRFEALHPRFENLYARVSLLPELLPDRVRVDPASAEASGLELSLEGGREAWSWWLNLARSNIDDMLAGGRTARSWDETWSLKGGAEWSGPRWTLTAEATLHSGWPMTALGLVDGGLVSGRYNARRFADYRTLDIRASRRVELEHGALDWFVEVNNVLDRRNPCCIDYSLGEAEPSSPDGLETEADYWLGAIPTLGVRLTF